MNWNTNRHRLKYKHSQNTTWSPAQGSSAGCSKIMLCQILIKYKCSFKYKYKYICCISYKTTYLVIDFGIIYSSFFSLKVFNVFCKTEYSMEEGAPSVSPRKLQRIRGGFFLLRAPTSSFPGCAHLATHLPHRLQKLPIFFAIFKSENNPKKWYAKCLGTSVMMYVFELLKPRECDDDDDNCGSDFVTW